MSSLSYIVHKNINDKLTNHNHINNIRSVFCNANRGGFNFTPQENQLIKVKV